MRRSVLNPYYLSDEQIRDASDDILMTLSELAAKALSRALKVGDLRAPEIRYLMRRVDLELETREWDQQQAAFDQLNMPLNDREIVVMRAAVMV